MVRISEFSKLRRQNQARRQDARDLAHTAAALDLPLRAALRALAEAVWYSSAGPGWLLRFTYRLRRQDQPGAVTWWIERDVPPLDLYRCAAYQVRLERSPQGRLALNLISGERTLPVPLDDRAALHAALERIGQDRPLLIRRSFGPALDP